MIGPKKLSAIRQELRGALAATGDDPIRWLEERMAAPGRPHGTGSGESEILKSLRRILEPTGNDDRPRRRVGTKK